MTKVTLNPISELIAGKIGNMVVRHAHAGKLSLIKHPAMSHVKWTQPGKPTASASSKPQPILHCVICRILIYLEMNEFCG